jgi:hypothetical protein
MNTGTLSAIAVPRDYSTAGCATGSRCESRGLVTMIDVTVWP